MAKPPASFLRKNRASPEFQELFGQIPADIRKAARKSCTLFHKNPAAKSLRYHRLKDTKTGKHISGSISVSITLDYRAIGIEDHDNGIIYWYWVGDHAAYDKFTGSR